MSFVSWTDDLSVGHHGIDHQHQRLIELINRYHDVVERSGDRRELMAAFQNIATFAIEHFRDEEAEMQRYHYPQLARHQVIHQQLLDRVGALKGELAKGTAGVELQIQYFLKNWLTAHIRGIDHQYVPYLKPSRSAA